MLKAAISFLYSENKAKKDRYQENDIHRLFRLSVWKLSYAKENRQQAYHHMTQCLIKIEQILNQSEISKLKEERQEILKLLAENLGTEEKREQYCQELLNNVNREIKLTLNNSKEYNVHRQQQLSIMPELWNFILSFLSFEDKKI